MIKNRNFKFLLPVLVIGAGIYAFWNLHFIRPFFINYQPRIPHVIQVAGDSVLAASGKHYQKGVIGNFWLGKHFRDLWATPVHAPVLRLRTVSGGLKILKRGGGMQTISFTLADSTGLEYALRSVDKDPFSVLPEFLWPTVICDFIRDQISATDPYAFILVDELSERAGIPHENAKLVFVQPEDPAFKPFGLYHGGFFNLSPKIPSPEKVAKPEETFIETYSTDNMLIALNRNSKQCYLDTALFLKCRLFDLYIGDWDRHPGQWDWMAFSTVNDTVFRPVPKDRDQAFGHYQDGVFPFLFTRNFAVRKITSFTPDFQDVEGFSQNGNILDNRFLKNVSQIRFEQTAIQLQQQLSDQALKAAVRKYPEQIFRLIGQERLTRLKQRRNKLPQASREYCRIIKNRTLEL